MSRACSGALLLAAVVTATPGCSYFLSARSPAASEFFVGCFEGPNVNMDGEVTLILEQSSGDFSLAGCLAVDGDTFTLTGEVLADDEQRADLDFVSEGEVLNLELIRLPGGDVVAETISISASNVKFSTGRLPICDPLIELADLCPRAQFAPTPEDLN